MGLGLGFNVKVGVRVGLGLGFGIRLIRTCMIHTIVEVGRNINWVISLHISDSLLGISMGRLMSIGYTR